MNTFGDTLVVNDALDAVLIGCFLFGLVFTALTLVLGIADIGISHGHTAGHWHHGSHHDGQKESVSPISIGSITAFLTWFGGAAYLLRNGAGLYSLFSVLIGLAFGIAGGALVVWLLTVVRSGETVLEPGERVTGALGRVTSSIRAGGTGEMIYERRGVRHVCAARSNSGLALPRGAEVVVLRYEKGVAYVEAWDDVYVSERDLTPQLSMISEDHPPPP